MDNFLILYSNSKVCGNIKYSLLDRVEAFGNVMQPNYLKTIVIISSGVGREKGPVSFVLN